MIKLKPMIDESPDSLKMAINQPTLSHDSSQAYPFTIYKNAVFIGSSGGIHPFIRGDVEDKIKREKRIPTTFEQEFIYNAADWRTKMHCAGRIWTNAKVMSFWEYPTSLSETESIIIKFKHELNIDISDYQIEVIYDENDRLVVNVHDVEKAVLDIMDSKDKHFSKYYYHYMPLREYMEKYCK